MNKKLRIALFVLVAAGAATVLFTRKPDNGNRFDLAAVTRQDLQEVLQTTGTINPLRSVEVGSQVSGRITEIRADFNDQVKAGQVIARIDPASFEEAVRQNEARFRSAEAEKEKARINRDYARSKLDRGRALMEKNLISKEELDDLELDYSVAEAELQVADASLQQARSLLDDSRVDLAHTVIYSPVDGTVIERSVEAGQTVASAYQAPVLFEIAEDLTRMQMECYVDETDISKVTVGQTLQFTVSAFPSRIFEGTLKQIRYDPVVDSNVVTYVVTADVGNPELILRPGMTATASIIVGQSKGALAIPNTALNYTPDLPPHELESLRAESLSTAPKGGTAASDRAGKMSRIWLPNEDGSLRSMFILTGISDLRFTEVLSSNLQEGQQIITGSELAGGFSGPPMGMFMGGPPPGPPPGGPPPGR